MTAKTPGNLTACDSQNLISLRAEQRVELADRLDVLILVADAMRAAMNRAAVGIEVAESLELQMIQLLDILSPAIRAAVARRERERTAGLVALGELKR